MRKSSKWLLIAGFFLLITAALLALFELAALNRPYHMQLHADQDAVTATGLTQAGVARASDALLNYLRGENVDLTYSDSVYGTTQRVFGDDEVAHMRDVRALFDMARTVRSRSLVLGILLALAGFATVRQVGALFRTLRGAALLWCALIALGVTWVVLDFERAFTLFHRALFTNDLWMMTQDQLMIRLYPAEFFMALAGQIAVVWGIALLVPLVVGVYGARWRKRKWTTN